MEAVYNLPTPNFVEAFAAASNSAFAIAYDKGFWDGPYSPAEKIALCHSELSEALEAVRDPSGKGGSQPSTHIPEFTALEEELADEVIRIMDWAYGKQLRVGEAIQAKMAYNASREHRHGGKAF
jgi:NTP pyrophosphatase (non-canonical NTP hydrolase)